MLIVFEATNLLNNGSNFIPSQRKMEKSEHDAILNVTDYKQKNEEH